MSLTSGLRRPARRLAPAALGALLLQLAPGGLAAQASDPSPAEEPSRVTLPAVDLGERLLESRRAAQLRAAERIGAFHDFGFTDRVEESGITFVHRVVDDAGRSYKMVHYDHGNGLAVADVDGDDLYDVYFVSQLGRNELWKNLGDGRFRDVTDEAGVGLADRVGVAAAFADVDNDGDPDLYVTTVRMGNVLFQNDGAGRFTDVTETAGLVYSGHSSGAVFFDYDADGWLDLFLANVGTYTVGERGPGGYWVGYQNAFDGHLFSERTEPSILYRNVGGGVFEAVSEEVGLVDPGWSGDAAFVDLSGDRHPDLYVLNMQGDDRYWENVGGERFRDRTAELFPRTPWGSMGIGFFDWNNDGRPDLMLTDMHSDMSRQVGPEAEKLKSEMQWTEPYLAGGDNNIFGNAFYENRGDGKMEEISDLVGAENYWPWGLSVGDLNADGWEDVFIASSMSYPWRYAVNTVLLNDRGTYFRDAEFILGVEPRRGGATKTHWYDLDCSGPDRGHQACEGQEGRIEVWGALGTRSAAIFDLDEDGDLDVVTSEFHARPQVLVSDLAQKREINFLKVRLVGTRSNRDGLGARVTVRAGETAWTQTHDGKSGYLAQSSLPLYFGLGETTEVDAVEVEWPSGTTQRVTGVTVGTPLEIVEPAAADG
ncbi:MAG: CRTAC1 family protein [Thermoanaerobaculia bacterium]|nr:CRTAC1 family protein [Thermoanaerobaculia bacterium]